MRWLQKAGSLSGKPQGNEEQLDLECLSLSLPWGNFKQKVQKEAENRKLLESGFYVFFYYIV